MGKPHLSGKNDGEKLPFESHTYLQHNLQVFVNQKHPENRILPINSCEFNQVTYQQSKERERLLPLPTLFTGSAHCIVTSVFDRSRLPWLVTSFKALQLETRGFWRNSFSTFLKYNHDSLPLCDNMSYMLKLSLVVSTRIFLPCTFVKTHANNMYIFTYYIYI